jgi:hypothetical protein
MHPPRPIRPAILFRDLFLFHFKLVLDGVKGFCMVWLSVTAVLADLFLLGAKDRGQYFYAVLRMGERFDLWLNLYAPARRAGDNDDGLFGESRAGENSYMGRMEEWVRNRTDPAATPRV